jgi:flagellar protein FlbD
MRTSARRRLACGLLAPRKMIKLTRLNQHVVVVNPDHIFAADAAPDTTLRLVGGETILVRESLDELIERVVAYRRRTGELRDAGYVGRLTRCQGDDAGETEQEGF